MIQFQYFIVIDVLIGVVTFFSSKYFLERFNERKTVEKDNDVVLLSENELDENEKLVYEAIKNGAKTLNEVMKATGLPKATAYRKIKSLINKGLVNVEVVSNKRVLKVKKEEKSNTNNQSK
ncbi:helix-turn-helix domain-containing protein [Acidianus sulfidivorans JP7]|uniref:Transcription regulator TrmB N-terminal domain-containing protein n=1 Tax=Acidianus sulfidivorans JP7 TaxID=619593 RepID=A0A2U9IJP4_9CREN|nr:helix-turn-helix domain-containing protein [Acidianus sulfidivorans]AWR96258.1 helix-turn-helix domain-containing protein [Acidianus sulfidivorans JP7]